MGTSGRNFHIANIWRYNFNRDGFRDGDETIIWSDYRRSRHPREDLFQAIRQTSDIMKIGRSDRVVQFYSS